MSNTPTPPASPKHPWTILGRLTRAVREQNWFAVVLELVIVVLGVVIGFQVTSWGQGRADLAKEQTYLRQLAEDLRETEQNFASAAAESVRMEIGSGALQRSFYEQTRPHPDTLLSRIHESGENVEVNAVTATAEALVATGDLRLIQEDSLRSAITAYLQLVDSMKEMVARRSADFDLSFYTLRSGRDLSEDWDLFMTRMDWLSTADPLYPFPPGSRRVSRIDVEAFLSDPAMEAAAYRGVIARMDTRRGRERVLAATVALREQVEAKIHP